MGAKVETRSVIVTDIERRGEGKSTGDPVRIITQIWSLDGRLLHEIDPFDDSDGLDRGCHALALMFLPKEMGGFE